MSLFLYLEMTGSDPRGPALGDLMNADGVKIGTAIEKEAVGINQEGEFVFRVKVRPTPEAVETFKRGG